jgi:leucyl/phenylalanyl-tRNA--protein transferase
MAEGGATMGADFAPATVVRAYRTGYFPWPHEDFEYLWFSPDPRAIIPVDGLHISRRLARLLRRLPFRLTMDAAFEDVVAACARRDEGTWITPAYRRGYGALHALGWARSFEVWDATGALVGGLYGVRIGRLFAAESMFHRVSDASKVAMVAMMQWVEDEGIELVDVQVLTEHTERMGAVEIPRADFLQRLAAAVEGVTPHLPGRKPAGSVGARSGPRV